MTGLFLPFSADSTNGVNISSQGDRPCFILGRTARSLSLELQPETAHSSIFFTEKKCSGTSVFSDNLAEVEIFDSQDKMIFYQKTPEMYLRRNSLATIKLLISCAVRQGWKENIRAALFHGAMLTHPEYPEQSVLIFGISGMGKSTTAQRWKAVGGNAPAEDLILIYQDECGDFFARPLPTWSRYPETADFNICCKVKNVLHLQRGKQDEIVSANDKSAWSVDCAKALMFHHYLPNLSQEISAAIAFECMKFGEALRKKFDAYDINTNLDGDLYPVLMECFEP